MKKRVLNLYQCASEIGVPVAWLKEMADSGRVPCLRISKRVVRFNAGAVQAAISEIAAKNNNKRTEGEDV